MKTSKYVGVSWSKRTQNWVAAITNQGAKCEIGRFDDEQEAAKSYDRKAFLLGRSTNILKFVRV